MWISVHQAISKDILTISDILDEAAQWLEWHSLPLGREDEVSLEGIRPDIEAGLFYLAFYADVPAGVIKFQEDPLFWSDVPDGDSAFIHRLAVWRIFAGGSVSTALLNWAVSHARRLGKHYLRLRLCSRPSTSAIRVRKIRLSSPQRQASWTLLCCTV